MSGYRWGWRRRKGPGRPIKPRVINGFPRANRFIPASLEGTSISSEERVKMTIDEYEALRLVDYEGLLQEEAAQRMGVSWSTVAVFK
ncbi:MAG: DUF134 domain-containing protein [Thermoproteota archaeon]